jgi:hypothetical protein
MKIERRGEVPFFEYAEDGDGPGPTSMTPRRWPRAFRCTAPRKSGISPSGGGTGGPGDLEVISLPALALAEAARD